MNMDQPLEFLAALMKIGRFPIEMRSSNAYENP
jgi:hypothetical protein